MSLISLIYNKTEHDFVITTHSPYILTAINNMVFANDVAKEKGCRSISDIMEEDYLIDFNDVKEDSKISTLITHYMLTSKTTSYLR